MRALDKSKIHKILVVSLSNIGDVVLTLPVVDILKRDFPGAKISIIVGPKVESLLKGSPVFENVFIYNKHQPGLETLKWIMKLRKIHFDLAVDLRNSAISILTGAKQHTPLHVGKKEMLHMKLKHLKRLRTVHSFEQEAQERVALYISPSDQAYVQQYLQKYVGQDGAFAVMAPGSADQAKRWSAKGFAQVADYLHARVNLKTIFLGDHNDNQVVHEIEKLMHTKAVNMCGQSSLIQTAEYIRRCKLAIVNDSAALHIASYLNRPVIALFGYSDPVKYGPWSKTGLFLKAKGKPITTESTIQERIEFIESIKPEDVMRCIRMDAGEISLMTT